MQVHESEVGHYQVFPGKWAWCWRQHCQCTTLHVNTSTAGRLHNHYITSPLHHHYIITITYMQRNPAEGDVTTPSSMALAILRLTIEWVSSFAGGQSKRRREGVRICRDSASEEDSQGSTGTRRTLPSTLSMPSGRADSGTAGAGRRDKRRQERREGMREGRKIAGGR